MPTRKQRRRRSKTFRHEWETVLIDEEGNERPLDPDELRAEREEREAERAKARPAAKKPSPTARKVREVPPPSWERAMKRGGLMGVAMLLAFVFLFRTGSIAVRLGWGVFYAVAFVPLTYWIDRTAYRGYLRRLQKLNQPKG